MMELAEKLGFWSRVGALRLVMGALCAVIGWAFLLAAVLRERIEIISTTVHLDTLEHFTMIANMELSEVFIES